MKISPEKLKKARGNLSQTAVAKQVDLTRQQIWNYENGRSVPPVPVLLKLLTIYQIKFDDVMDDKVLSKTSNLI